MTLSYTHIWSIVLGIVRRMTRSSAFNTQQKKSESVDSADSAEAALRIANNRINDMIESAEMITFDLDMEKGEFTHNAQWCHIWQYPGPAEDGVKSLAFLLEHMEPASVAAFNALRTSPTLEDVINVDLEIRTYHNERRWIRHKGRILERDAQGRPVRVIGTGYDITLQKAAEMKDMWYKRHLEEVVTLRTAELEESRNLAEAASRAKSNFLSSMSHELRTPMNAIVGFAHIFDRTNLSDLQKNQLDKIKLSASTLLGIINDILDISKIEAGKLELEVALFRLPTVVETVCSIVDYAAFHKGLKLTVDMGQDVPNVLMGDAKRISQILLNLMNNAVKFTSMGNIVLRIARLPSSPNNLDGNTVNLQWEVQDCGIGLTEDQITRLFKPFMQADNTVTRRFGGTGLGLAICRQLVEMMGGSIGVRSQEGKGSTFYFTLPLALPKDIQEEQGFIAAEAEDSPEIVADIRKLQGKHILLVEDNDINQEIALALLEPYGMYTDVANNGMHAIEMCEKKQYHCILMDMQMPVMDGLDAARTLRKLGESVAEHAWIADVPIIAMTANAMSEDKQRCLNAGMNDHIGKPIEPALLEKCLLRWISWGKTLPA